MNKQLDSEHTNSHEETQGSDTPIAIIGPGASYTSREYEEYRSREEEWRIYTAKIKELREIAAENAERAFRYRKVSRVAISMTFVMGALATFACFYAFVFVSSDRYAGRTIFLMIPSIKANVLQACTLAFMLAFQVVATIIVAKRWAVANPELKSVVDTIQRKYTMALDRSAVNPEHEVKLSFSPYNTQLNQDVTTTI